VSSVKKKPLISSDTKGYSIKGISENLAFDYLNPSPFSKREGYMEFLEMP
jgi:hypothetical protein